MIKKAALLLIFIIFFASTAKADPSTSGATKHPPATFIAGQQISLATGADHIYNFTNDVSITNPSQINGNQTGVIFIKGNLTIGPIPGSNKLTHGNNNSGLVFIVKGNVNIHQSVEEIHAVIIAEGIICTAYDDSTSCPTSNVSTITGTNNPIKQLIINGSLISLNQSDTIPIKFMRSRGVLDASEPAEKIVYQPKYLVILRNLVSDTFQKWSEIQP